MGAKLNEWLGISEIMVVERCKGGGIYVDILNICNKLP